MRKIALAPNLRLSAVELATSVTSVLGIRGSGKSNLAAILVEGFLDAQIPVVVLDRVGIWFSLCLGRDGKSSGRRCSWRLRSITRVTGGMCLRASMKILNGRSEI